MGHLVDQIIGGDSHTFQQVALCILGKRERHVEVEVARYISYPSAIAGFVVGSEHRLRSVTVSAYCLYVVTLTLQNEGCHLRHTRTVVVEQDGGRDVSAQALRRYRNLLRNPRGIAVWIIVLFLAHVGIDGCLGDEIVGKQTGIYHAATTVATEVENQLLDLALSQRLQEQAAVTFYAEMIVGKFQVAPVSVEFTLVPEVIGKCLAIPAGKTGG